MYCWPLTLTPHGLAVRRDRLVGRRVGDLLDAVGCEAVGVGVRRGADVVEHHERHDREHDEDNRGADRPADLELRVAANLRCNGVLASTELDQRVEQNALDTEEHDGRDREDDLVERVDAVGVGRPAGLRRPQVGGGPARQRKQSHQRRSKGQGEDAAAGARTCGGQGGGHSIHAAAECCLRLGARSTPSRSNRALIPSSLQFVDRRSGALEDRPAFLDEGGDALLEVLRRGHLLLQLSFEGELLLDPRVDPGVQLALCCGVGLRRPGG